MNTSLKYLNYLVLQNGLEYLSIYIWGVPEQAGINYKKIVEDKVLEEG